MHNNHRLLLLMSCSLFRCHNKRPQGRQLHAFVQEWVFEQVFGCRSFLHVHLQAFVQEILQLGGQFTEILNIWFTFGCNPVDSFKWCLVEIGWFTFKHFYDHDSQTPDINFLPIVFPEMRKVQVAVNCLKFQTLFTLFSNKMWDIRAEIHKILVRIANREDPDQNVSSEAV